MHYGYWTKNGKRQFDYNCLDNKFLVFSTRLAAIGKSLPKYISAYEMDGYKEVFIIFILRQQIPTLGSGPCRLQLLETDSQSRHSEK